MRWRKRLGKASTRKKVERERMARAKRFSHVDPREPGAQMPPGAVPADVNELAHNNTVDRLPRFYADQVITCRACGIEELWPAERQKWWYEVAKGSIESTAVLCRACRGREKRRRDEARRVHLEGKAKKEADKR